MTEEKHMSNYNLVKRGLPEMPLNVMIRDCTLREGEQASDVGLGLKDKLVLAHKLDEIGIHQIQGGYPGRSKIDQQTIQKMKEEGIKARVEALVQVFKKDWKEQIDAAVESGADVIGLMYPSSDIRLKYVQKTSRNEMIKRSVDSVTYANKSGKIIGFAPTDTTRTELEFLKEIYTAVTEAGARVVSLADTAGAINPLGMKFLVRELLDTVKVPMSVHCHNDFGLALANAISAVEAGAQIVDGTIGGLGERAGNACLEELVVTLQVLYERNLGIKTDLLSNLTTFAFDLMGVSMSNMKPLVGENAFAHKLDAHVEGVMSYPYCYETISPDLVGNKRKIVVGKYSGPFIIRMKLKDLGLAATDDELHRIIPQVEQKAIEKKASLTDEEFTAIVKAAKKEG